MDHLSYTDYTKEVTDESLQLLKNFLNLVKEKGVEVVIIGGWAVEAFKKGPGSKDIDIVLRSGRDMEKLSSDDFFSDNTFDEMQQGWPVRFEKQIFVNGEEKTIICEIFNAELEREDYEKRGIRIHWNLTYQFREQREIDGLQIFVPKRELLIILKIIAAVDRYARFDRTQNNKLPSKIWKDYRDIAVLCLNEKLDKEFLQKYITETNLIPHMAKFIFRYKDEYKEILDNLGTTPEYMESSLKF